MDGSTTIRIPDLFSAKGLTVVVTGGGTGIGLALASSLYQASAHKIYIVGRRMDKLEAAAKSIDPSGEVVIALQCDVTSPESISSVVKHVEQQAGYVDVLINNAGISGPNHKPAYSARSIEELQSTLLRDWHGWADTYAVNTSAVVGVGAAFLHLLDAANKRRGWVPGKVPEGQAGGKAREWKVPDGADLTDLRTSQIITVSSIAAFNRHVTAGLPYTSSKAGAVALGKALANLLAPWGIRSNVVCPGLFPSEMTVGAPTSFPPNLIPAGRQGNFEEVAGTILYLVGRGGAYVNGAVQVVDGGRLSVMPATF